MLNIDTTRFSTVVAAFVKAHPHAVAYLDKVPQTDSLESWCTNERLKGAIDFSLAEAGVEFLGFHDGPRNMWASDAALAVVEALASEAVLRYSKAIPRNRGFLAKLFAFGKSSD
jgi:hypothetical protein